MAEPEEILEAVDAFFDASASMKGLKVMITAGPTYEKIDPVRFIGNYSSGKLGYAIADEAARRGAEVTVVSGPVSVVPSEPGVRVIKVESAREMMEAAEREFAGADVAVMAAAVADYAPAEPALSKIKREGGEPPVIRLVKNPDIAAALGERKRPGQTLVGFALETDHEMDNAADKMKRKHLDMIVLNSLRDKGAGFGTDTNLVTILSADGRTTRYDLKSKREVACDILDQICAMR